RPPASINWLLIAGLLTLELGLALGAYFYIVRRRQVLAASADGGGPSIVDEPPPAADGAVLAPALPQPWGPRDDAALEYPSQTGPPPSEVPAADMSVDIPVNDLPGRPRQ